MTTALDAELPVPPPEEEGPPVRIVTAGEWVRANLFNSWFNTILTVLFGGLLAWLTFRLLWFVLVTAEWEIVRRNLRQFMVGRYPREELWRPWIATYLVAALIGLAVGVAARIAQEERLARGAEDAARRGWFRRFWPVLLFFAVVVSFVETLPPALLLVGAVVVMVLVRLGAKQVPRRVARFSWIVLVAGLYLGYRLLQGCGRECGLDDWGGLHLTLFVTVAGIVLAFPFGLLLALGRRSNLPGVRLVSIAYIEAFRGVPLITLLLLGRFVIGFFLPPGDLPPLVTRALIAIVIFEAAYIAEVVRGGLQAVPRGQYEAGQAVGLSPWKVTRRIVLPQALRAVIPAMVGQFISLYKDTSLLSILGIFELLDVARTVTSQPDFVGQGLAPVTLAFAGFAYWVGSYTMSRESQALERRLGVGER